MGFRVVCGALMAWCLVGGAASAWAHAGTPKDGPPVEVAPPTGTAPFEAPTPELAEMVKRLVGGHVAEGAEIWARHLNSPRFSGPTCDADYVRLFSKEAIDARLAIGYFDYVNDATDSVRYVVSFNNETSLTIGDNVVFSPFIYAEAMSMLQRPCDPSGTGTQICGFHGFGGRLEKQIPGISGQGSVTFRLRVTQAAASPFHHELNTGGGRLAGLQDRMSAECEDNFFGGLGEADVVAYMGHARNGGGPDCRPTVLNAIGHPDYADHYKVARPGFHQMVDSLKLRSSLGAPFMVSIMACLSQVWFGEDLRKVAPQSRLVLTGDLMDNNALLTGALASLDAVMRRQCPEAIDGEATLPPGIAFLPNPVRVRGGTGYEVRSFAPANGGRR